VNLPVAPDGAARRNRLPRSYRLRLRRHIRPLFARQGVQTATAGSLRALFREVPRSSQAMPVLVGFAPGKRRTAVIRNKIRRKLREAYRVHQHALMDLFALRDTSLSLMLLFRSQPEHSAYIPKDMPVLLQRVAAACLSPRS